MLMKSLIISNSTHIFTLNSNPSTTHTKSPSISKSISGLFNSHKKVPPLRKLPLGLSYECFSLGNRVGFVSANVGGSGGGGGDDEDVFYMRMSLDLARKAIGCTSPNPMVGCVIVKDGIVVGRGFHPKAGQPHAEVFSLRDAGDLAENATAYVTLEPCNHYGRTPPCSEALIKAKVKKVVVGMVDPNPIVSSRGIDRLREAGIEVVVGVEEAACKKLNEAFIHKMLYGKPFLTLRYSITINGDYSEDLGENVTKCGGYYSRLLQEYDAVIHSSNLMTQDITFLSSQEPNTRQPQHIFFAKNHVSLTRILNLPVEGEFMPIIFVDKELPLGPQMSHKRIKIVVLDHISLDAILDYCSRQGFCNVLVDLRGKFDGFEEILAKGLEANLLQKAVVEVLPLWVENRVYSSLTKMGLTQKKGLKNLSTSISGDSVVLEGYF